MPESLRIQPLDAPAARRSYFDLAAPTFIRDVPAEVGAPDWLRFAAHHPRFDPRGVRGAFLGETCVGGYLVEERALCLGIARLPAGRIGAVVVHPHYRHQGIGSALMHDALDHARARGLALLLLNGAAHFYDPFGYRDIFDRTEHAVACADLRGQTAGPYRVRPATVGDAEALLALYQRHYGSYAGSYDRTVAEQAYVVQFSQTVERSLYTWRGDIGYDAPMLAVDAEDQPRGYLAVPWGPIRSFGCEVACDDWPATLTLAQYHAAQLEALPDAPAHVRWPLPPTAAAFYALADHLPVVSESRQRPHAGWMACIVDVPALARHLLPEWQACWRRCRPSWEGTFTLAVDGDALALQVDAAGPRLLAARPDGGARVQLSRAVLTQLMFGYRPVSWAVSQAGQRVPPDLIPMLEALFPPRHTWIAPTDGC